MRWHPTVNVPELERAIAVAAEALAAHLETCGPCALASSRTQRNRWGRPFAPPRRCVVGLRLWKAFRQAIDRDRATRALRARSRV